MPLCSAANQISILVNVFWCVVEKRFGHADTGAVDETVERLELCQRITNHLHRGSHIAMYDLNGGILKVQANRIIRKQPYTYCIYSNISKVSNLSIGRGLFKFYTS
jgi:hypothetical protein